MSRKIIAFTGAGGTGKTTVAEAVRFNVPSYVDYLRKEFYGLDARYGDLTDPEEILRFQYGILFAQFAAEKIYKDFYPNIKIMPIERSSIDYGAYMLNQIEKYSDQEKTLSIAKNYVNTCIDHANTAYDAIVYFPIGKFVPSDKEGSSKERDEDSILKTDKYINHILKKVDVPVLILKPVDLKSRVNTIFGFSRKIKNKNRSEENVAKCNI